MADDKTFTQAEVDSIIEGRLAREHEKYADYDSLKDKAGKYDEMQAKGKTDLEKEKEKSSSLEAELNKLKKADTVRQAREKVAKDTSVPVELLTGEDEETCKKQAEAIMKFAKPKSYIVGGRDYLTGISMKKPIGRKIWTISSGKEKVEYKLEGDN